MVNLVTNPREDLELDLELVLSEVEGIIGQANEIRRAKLESVLQERGLPSEYIDASNVTAMMERLGMLASIPSTDYVISGVPIEVGPFFCDSGKGDWEFQDGVFPNPDFFPEICQKSILPGQTESFFPFQNCSVSG